MKSIFVVIVCCLGLLGCTNTDTQLEHINGYWEIVSVTNTEGIVKTFTINQTIDYIEIKGHKGFRKKLQPDLSGKYKTTESTEYIEVNSAENQIVLLYTTPFSSWQEVVISVTDDQLVVENEAKTKYTYKRYQPLNLQ